MTSGSTAFDRLLMYTRLPTVHAMVTISERSTINLPVRLLPPFDSFSVVPSRTTMNCLGSARIAAQQKTEIEMPHVEKTAVETERFQIIEFQH